MTNQERQQVVARLNFLDEQIAMYEKERKELLTRIRTVASYGDSDSAAYYYDAVHTIVSFY